MYKRLPVVLIVASALTVLVAAGGCQKTMSSGKVAADGGGVSSAVANADPSTQAGALLWSQNCGRCHNLRNPRERSDREWDVIVQHMRVRANLTATEHRQILAFLQSAN